MLYVQLIFLASESGIFLIYIVLDHWGNREKWFSIFKFRDLIQTVDSSAELRNNRARLQTGTAPHQKIIQGMCVQKSRSLHDMLEVLFSQESKSREKKL